MTLCQMQMLVHLANERRRDEIKSMATALRIAHHADPKGFHEFLQSDGA